MVERDAEIVRLRKAGRTYGQILQAIKPRWPQTERGTELTVNVIKSVVQRARLRGEL
jgi:hypothetical protein